MKFGVILGTQFFWNFVSGDYRLTRAIALTAPTSSRPSFRIGSTAPSVTAYRDAKPTTCSSPA